MPIPTDEQIAQWRERWSRHPGLADRIAEVLKGDKPAEDIEKSIERMWIVNKLLEQENESIRKNDFQIYIGEGFEAWNNIRVPVLDLRGINLE